MWNMVVRANRSRESMVWSEKTVMNRLRSRCKGSGLLGGD